MDTMKVLTSLSDFKMTLQGVAGFIDTMANEKEEDEYIYSRMRFVLLENILFDVLQNMDKLYKEIERQR